MARKGPEMYNNYVQQWGGDGSKKTSRFKMFSTHKSDKASSTPKLLDTSVIMMDVLRNYVIQVLLRPSHGSPLCIE